MSRWLPSPSAQNPACKDPGKSAVIEFYLAIDNGEVDAAGELIRLSKAGVVNNGCGIEDRDVCEIAGLQKAQAVEMLALGRERSDFADGGLK